MLDLPSTDPREINDMINLQVGKQTPYSKDEIISANKIIYSMREGYTKVMLAVAHRNIVNERVETLKKAGVNVEKVAISSEAVYNWFNIAYMPDIKVSASGTVALLDIDSNYSDFIAIRAGKLVFTKNLFIGANNLSDRSEPWADKLIEELRRCLQRYYTEERNTRIEKMFLTGAAANIGNLDITLANALQTAVEKTAVFKNIRNKDSARITHDENMGAVSLTALTGAVLRQGLLEIDLTPGEQKIIKIMEARRNDLIVTGILFVSIAMALSFILLLSYSYKNMYLAQLKKQVAQISSESGEIEKMRLSIDLVKRTIDAKRSSVNIIHEIYGITPPEISLSAIDIDEDKQVILKGRGYAMSEVFKFIKKLEESDIFSNVKAAYTRTRKEKENERETEYAEFEIVCPYEGR